MSDTPRTDEVKYDSYDNCDCCVTFEVVSVDFARQLERELSALRALIADDSYAMTFQSIGQYRTALLSHLNQPPRQNRNSKSS